MKIALFNLGLSTLFLVAPTSAQTAPSPQSPQMIDVSITPSPAAVSALRYRLMPATYDLTPGNAAPMYFTAALIVPKISDEQRDQLSTWMSMPFAELPREGVNETLAGYEHVFEQLDTAARREYCRWEPAFREQKFAALLSHLGPLRDAARALALKARLQIADGKFDDAVRSLQTGYAMAYHIQSDGVLIQSLVAAAMVRLFDGVVRDWQAAPYSPNLYWAIAELPRPFVDIANAMRLEQALLVQMFPMLKDPDRATSEQWQQAVVQFNQLATEAEGKPGASIHSAVELAVLTASALPRARAGLIESGWGKDQVEALPPQQAVAIHVAREFRMISDDLIKWMNLPYVEAIHGLTTAYRRVDDIGKLHLNPLLSFVPAVNRAHATGAMIDRETAALQTIEAIRAYTAANNGALPRALTDLGDPPAPIDPMSGEAFVYQTDGDRFTLEGLVIAGDQPRNGMRIEGTVKR